MILSILLLLASSLPEYVQAAPLLDGAKVPLAAAGNTTRVSVASDGTQGNSDSLGYPSISADGRYVAFASDATNLVSGDTNGGYDAFAVRWRWWFQIL